MTKKKKCIYPLANAEHKNLIKRWNHSLNYTDLSNDTIRSYIKDLYNYVLFLQDRSIFIIESTDEDFDEYLKLKDCSASRKIRIFSSVNNFFIFASKKRNDRLMKKNPLENYDSSYLYYEIKYKDK